MPSTYVVSDVGQSAGDKWPVLTGGMLLTLLNFTAKPFKITVGTAQYMVWPSFAQGIPGAPTLSCTPTGGQPVGTCTNTITLAVQGVPVGSTITVQPMRVNIAGESNGSGSVPVWWDQGSVGPTATSAAALTAAGPPLSVTVGQLPNLRPQPTTISGSSSSQSGISNAWWYTTSPAPLIDYAADGSYFLAQTTWGDPNGYVLTPTSVNIVLRTAPLLRLYSNIRPTSYTVPGNGNVQNGGIPTEDEARAAAAFVYLGSAPGTFTATNVAPTPSQAMLVPGGPQVLLTPLVPNDVLVCELPAATTTDKSNEVVDACNQYTESPLVFTSVTMAALAAARPKVQTGTLYNILTTPIQIAPFITLVADNGAEVTLVVGDTQLALQNVTVQTPTNPAFITDVGSILKPGLTIPGMLPITSTCASTAQFVGAACGTPGFSRCRSILGKTPTTCLGAFSLLQTAPGATTATTLEGRCAAACTSQSDPETNAACRDIQTKRCTPTGFPGDPTAEELDALPECACYRLQTSKVPTYMVAGQPMTYNSTTAWFAENFGGGGVPAFLTGLPNIYPACKGPDAGLAAWTPAPSVVDCLALVNGVTATNDSKVRIKLKNQCQLTQQGGDSALIPPVPELPGPEVTSKSVITAATIAGVGFVILVILCGVGVWCLKSIQAQLASQKKL